MSESIIGKRSFDFAVIIINLYKHITCINKEYVISNQLLRSGTSIGANVKESLRGQSKRDFLAKMNIALKEANETEYWLELLMITKYIKSDSKVLSECREICKMLNSIVKTTKDTL